VFRCSKLVEGRIVPRSLRWPWVAFSPDRGAAAFPVEAAAIAVRSAASLSREARVALPAPFATPTVPAVDGGTTSRQPGLHALAVHPDASTVVALAWHGDLPAACVARAGKAPEVIDLGPALGDMAPMAATFSRDGESLWVSAESAGGAALARLRFRDFALESKVAFAPGPPPAAHELFLHPAEDAVLLTMACGQDGTFTRVARFTGGRLDLVATAGDAGLEPSGVAEATDDGGLVCLVTSDAVETRRWPDLTLASRRVFEELVTSYCGVRVGQRFVVSATFEHDDGGEDERALVLRDGLEREDDAPAPPGMWAGRLGRDRLVTIGREKVDSRALFIYAVEV
jgi:hypothetical protein